MPEDDLSAIETAAVELENESETAALATRLAARAAAGDVLALKGELGAGKTSFARAFIRALGGGEEVPSPTFTLVQVYDTAPAPVWHLDCYRLKSPEEAWELGIEEAFAGGISLIEWPERLGPLLPARRLELRIDFAERPQARRVTITAGPEWRRRLAGIAPDA